MLHSQMIIHLNPTLKISFTVLFILLSWGTHANTLPPDLTYKGSPIDPYCISSLAEGEARFEAVQLSQCLKKKESIEISPSSSPLLEKSFEGYEYHHPEYCIGNICYVFWKVIAQVGEHRYLIWIENASGSTGRFSSLLVLERQGDRIQNILELTAGDRSFLGIVDVRYKDGEVFVQQRATPSIILEECMTHFNPHHPALSQQDLPTCAVCESGILFRKGLLKENSLKTYEIHFHALSETNLPPPSSPWQKRFNTAVSEVLKTKKGILTESEMKAFAQAVCHC